MEEADALCSSIGILVRGSMRCIGPIQYLKNKYGRGYTLEVKVKPNRAPMSISNASSPSHIISAELGNSIIREVQQKVMETFPNAVLDEQFDERLIYKVPQTDVMSLALIFEMLEKTKSDGLVDEYALSQTTLEQIFLQFARQQEEEDDKEESGDDISQLE
ncbi:ATP-binding cassette sub-family A member 5 [Portunus trituberculatus]|uniref:ATP-binding cassette sub-family A member 5 n=2 Tax=Portunus trituberculatus TaxID=210409 RepID=A0A5B7DV58_PORTR|nr:ATP-binding cassette sub-family A member 5 [Portunus trituberculatus]